MAKFMYTVTICSSRIWMLVNSFGVHHPGPSLYKAASGLNLAWVEGGEWLGWRRGTSVLHMIPHRTGLSRDSLHTSFLCMAHQPNCTLNGSDVTHCTPYFFLWEQV